MCVSVPGRVIEVAGASARVETDGKERLCTTLARPDVKVGDYVLTHANLIITVISEEDAQEILRMAREMQECRDTEMAPGFLTTQNAPTSFREASES